MFRSKLISPRCLHGWAYSALPAACVLLGLLQSFASETLPRKPFAEWADVPAERQFNIRFSYVEGEAYHVWYGREQKNISVKKQGEEYGIDPMYGVIAMEYGLTPRWTADLNVGYGTVGTRSYNPGAGSQSTSGILDVNLGVRYQIFHESDAQPWLPTFAFRAGGILPGTYNKRFPFAPGSHSAAIEPSIYVKKHFGWTGFGAYGEASYRWMRTSGDDQYTAAVGFFQEICSWNFNAGYRHFQQISGDDLLPVPVGTPISYSPQVREISDAMEAGFSYTTTQRWKWGFYTTKIFDGSNTDSRFLISGYLEIPFQRKKPSLE
jgi:hypothetical protein